MTNLEILTIAFNFIGTIVIIISLLYVAKQTKLTNKIAQGESERELFDTFNDLLHRYSDSDSIDLIQRAYVGYEDLSNLEKARFNILYVIPHINNCEQFYQLHALKLISDTRLRITLNIGIAILKSPGGSQTWLTLQHAFNPEFVKYLNREIDKAEHVPPLPDLLTWLRPDEGKENET